MYMLKGVVMKKWSTKLSFWFYVSIKAFHLGFSADDGSTGFMQGTYVLVNYNGTVLWPVPVKLKSSCKVDITYFPFGRPRMYNEVSLSNICSKMRNTEHYLVLYFHNVRYKISDINANGVKTIDTGLQIS